MRSTVLQGRNPGAKQAPCGGATPERNPGAYLVDVEEIATCIVGRVGQYVQDLLTSRFCRGRWHDGVWSPVDTSLTWRWFGLHTSWLGLHVMLSLWCTKVSCTLVKELFPFFRCIQILNVGKLDRDLHFCMSV